MAAEFLEREAGGISVETATSVDGALELLPGEFDCVVSDYDMPGRDGLELLREVREAHPALPFILFTGKGSEQVASEAISAGVSDYLQKGAGSERYSLLANRIENLVSQQRAMAELETRARQQRLLAELGQQALVATELGSLFEAAAAFVSEGLGTEFAKVLELCPDEQALLLRAGVGWREGLVGERTVGAGADSQAGHTLRSEEPIVVTNLEAEDRFQGPPLLTEHGVTSGISVIIGSLDDPWGVLGTHSTRERTFTEDDITFMQNVSNVLANAIERQEDRSQLRETREWHHRVLEHLSDHVILVDESAEVTYCSPSVGRVLGYAPEEVVGADAFEFVHPDDRELVASAFAETVGAPSGEVRVEYRLRAKDGTYRWIEAHGGNYLDDPVIEGVMISVRDVTDRKAHEQELERYETILENLDDVVFVVAPDWTVEYTSPAILQYVDVPIEALEGSPVMGLADTYVVDQEGADRFEAALERALGGETAGAPERVELTLEFDGSEVVFEYLFSPIRRGEEEPEGVAVTMREITQRKEREGELSESNQLLSTLFSTIPVGVAVLDTDGAIVRANRRAEDVLGLTESELTERTYSAPEWEIHDGEGETVPPDDLPFARVMATGLPVYDYEHGIRWPDGRERWLSINAAPVTNADGEIVEVVTTIADATDARASKLDIEAQNRQLEEFARIVSHDLRNPLAVAQGRLELARADHDSEDLAAVARAHGRMSGLIEDLLTLAREGESLRDLEPIRLDELARDCWRTVDSREATLEANSGLLLEADRSRLRQLIENVVRNAIDHGGDEVSISLGGLESGFYIEDDGPGIPAEIRADVFEPGFTTATGGIGYGLSIVEDVVEAHGWAVRITDGSAGGARLEVTGVDVAG